MPAPYFVGILPDMPRVGAYRLSKVYLPGHIHPPPPPKGALLTLLGEKDQERGLFESGKVSLPDQEL